MQRSTISLREGAVVSVICFGLFTIWSTQAVLAGFPEASYSDTSAGWTILIEVVLGASAILYLRARGFETASLYPRPGLRGSLIGIGLFVSAWVVGTLSTSFFYTPEKRQMAAFSYSHLTLASTVIQAMVNGTYEEIFLLGVLARGLRGFGLSFALGLSLLVRVGYHLYQGPLGVIWVLAVGTTLTLGYVLRGDLWPPVLAHILLDIVPVVL